MKEEQKQKAEVAHGKLAEWLAGFGVPGNWAKVISGAVIGGVIGALATCQQSCTASYTQTAAGDIAAKVTIVEPDPYRK